MRTTLLVLLAIACTDSLTPAPSLDDPLGALALSSPISLTVTDVVPGAVTRFTVSGLGASETTHLVRAGSAQPGACPGALGGHCLGIGPKAFLVGPVTADASGVAILDVAMPSSLSLGLPVAFQAVAVRGVGGADSVLSGVVEKVTGGIPCGNGVLDLGEDCDDGNLVDDDGCDTTCVIEGCLVPELPLDERALSITDYTTPHASGIVRLGTGELLLAAGLGGADNRIGLAWLDPADLATTAVTGLGTSDEDELQQVVADGQGGAFLAANTHFTNALDDDGLAVRIDSAGSVQWATRLERDTGTWDETIHDAVVGNDGSVLLVGTLTESSSGEHYGLTGALWGSAGTMHFARAWRSHVFDDSEYFGGAATADGGYLVVGAHTDSIYEGFMMKLDASGNEQWSQDYESGSTIDVMLLDVIESWDGGAVAVGYLEEGSNDSDMLVVHTDSGGAVRWATALSNPELADEAVAVVQSPQTCATDPVDGASCLVEGDACASSLTELCTCELGGLWSCEPGTPAFVVAGTTDTAAGEELQLARFDADGVLQAQTAWATGEIWQAQDLDVQPDGGIVALASGVGGGHLVRTDAQLDPGCGGTTTTLTTYPVALTEPTYTATVQYDTVDFDADPATVSPHTASLLDDDPLCAATVCPTL